MAQVEKSNTNNNNSVVTSNNSNNNTQKRRVSMKRSFEDDGQDVSPPTKFVKMSCQAPVLRVKKLSNDAKIPIKGSEYAAGYDLYSSHECIIEANGKALIKTDISMAIPIGCYGRIAPRSGLAWKNHIDIGAGVIDNDYRGNVGVVMFNHSNKQFKVTKHMRIAQLILERYEHRAVLLECDNLDDTQRGIGGFGSTGTGVGVAVGVTTTMMNKLDVTNDNTNEKTTNVKDKTNNNNNEMKETEKENENNNVAA